VTSRDFVLLSQAEAAVGRSDYRPLGFDLSTHLLALRFSVVSPPNMDR
jgi:hypothetical protein